MTSRLRNLLLMSSASLVLGAAPAAAQPTGGTVVGGTATIQGAGTSSVIVNQTTNRAVINWNTFNIGTGGAATFNQPGSSAITLNRVTGGLGASTIDGSITANGRVFIINRDGILIGRNARINTAGFLATTHDIRNDDFMAGRMNFNISGRPDASIVNLGRITATSHGFAALVAPGVRNTGTITARLGTVALASGNSFTLDMYGDRLIQLAVGDQIASKVIDVSTGKPLSSLVTNEGRIRANGGRVELTAAAARAVVDSVINTKGVIEANSIGRRNGKIVLGGATARPGLPKQTIRVSGRVTATAKTKKARTGGTIQITGEDIQFAAAMLDVSGRRGGGRILVGGDTGGGKPIPGAVDNPSAALESHAIPTATTVTVDAATRFNASATQSGNGGKVILWSDSVTSFAGTIYARAGEADGDGGFVEVSGKHELIYAGSTDTRAPLGRAGTLLLDPDDYIIDAAAAGTIVTNLTTSNVLIQTTAAGNGGNGDIFVNANISWSTNHNLTLSAYRNIDVASGVIISNTGAGNLVMRADNTGRGSPGSFDGEVRFCQGPIVCSQFRPGSGLIDFSKSTGQVSIYYNPFQLYSSGYDYSSNVETNPSIPNQLTAYMLVNNANSLGSIDLSSGNNYALGRDFSAAGFTGFAPDAALSGVFDGNGGLGVNHTISDLALTSPGQGASIGLFPSIDTTGIVRNLNVATSPNTIIAGADNQSIGVIAGVNAGLITKVNTSGFVDGGTFSQVFAGGIAGRNVGTINDSVSRANISVGDSTENALPNFAGGAVGFNSGHILRVAASGNVNGGSTRSAVGGLVGISLGNIVDSYALGSVSGATAGGLVAAIGQGSIQTSFSAGRVTATSNGGGGGVAASGLGEVINSFWDRQTSGQITSVSSPDTAGLTTAQLQAALPTGFSNAIWGIVPGASYPYLKHQFTGGTPQVVSGLAFDNQGAAAAGATVSGLINGQQLASVLTGAGVTTGANGYYYFLLNPNSISANTQVLTYTTGANAGAAFAHNATGSISGLDMLGGYRHDITGAATLSAVNAGIATAIGGDTTVQALVDALPNRRIDASGAGFTIDQALATHALVLSTHGTIDQSAPINAAKLALLGTGGVYNLTQGNQVSLLAGDTGAIFLTNAGNLAIGTVAGFSGVTATALVLSTPGDVTQTAPIVVTNLAAIGGGNFAFTHAGNDVATFSAQGGNVTLIDQGALNIGLVANLGGVHAASLTLQTAGSVTQTAPIAVTRLSLQGGGSYTLDDPGNQVTRLLANASSVRLTNAGDLTLNTAGDTFQAGTLVLNSNGKVSQDGAITVGNLALLGTGATYTLNHAANQIGELAANVSNGTVNLSTTGSLNIGTVAGTSGLSASMAILTSAGTVTQTAPITVGSLGLLGSGGHFTLDHHDNAIGTLAADVGSSGFVSVTDNSGLVIGAVNPSGVTADTLILSSTGAVTQTAPIMAAQLALRGGGTFTLNHAGNQVTRLTANTQLVQFTDSTNLTLNTIAGSGIDFNVATLVLTRTGNGTVTVSQSAPITVGSLALLGDGPGSDARYTLNDGGNQIGTLAALIGTQGTPTGIINVASTGATAIGSVAGINGVTAGIVVLSGTETVTQSHPIITDGLALRAAGGNGQFTLNHASNAIERLAAQVGSNGSVSITSNSGVVIGNVAGTDGVIANALSISSTGTVTQNSPIHVGSLALTGNGGSFTLDHHDNAIGTFAAGTGFVRVTSNPGLIIGTVNSTAGVSAETLILTSTGTVTQTAPITVGSLGLLGTGGRFTLDHHDNAIGTLAADVGSTGFVSVTDNNGFVIGTVNPSGITADTLILSSTGTVTQTAPIAVNKLALIGSGGVHNLTHQGNQVGILAGDTGAIFLTNAGSLAIGTVAGFSGVTATALVLSTPGDVTQTAPIMVTNLAAVGGGNFAFTHAGNDVATFSAQGGNVTLTDQGALNIGLVANLGGVHAANLTLQTAGTVTQTAPIMVTRLSLQGGGNYTLDDPSNQVTRLLANASSVRLTNAADLTLNSAGDTFQAGTLVLNSNGSVSQDGPIAVGNFALRGTGATYVLNNAGNQIGELAANISNGTINLSTTGSLNIGTVAGTSGLSASTAILNSAGTVTQTAPITVGSLGLLGSGGHFTLDHHDNAIGTLAADVGSTGFVSVTDNSGLVIGAVNPSGVTADTLVLSSAGAVTQTAPITVSKLALIGTGGSFTLDHHDNAIGTFAAGTGSVRVTSNPGLIIGTVNSTAGVSAETLILTSAGTVTQTAPITVGSLGLLGTGGSFTLDHHDNTIGTLAADVGTTGFVSVTDHTGLVIGAVNPSGVTADTLVLSSTGAVTQTAPIAVNKLALQGAGGSFTLTNTGNQIGTLAANTGSVSLADQGDLTIGSVAGVSGVTTTGALTLQQIGSTIFGNAPVNVGTFDLTAGNWVQVTASLPSFHALDFRIGANASFLRATGGDGSAAHPYSLTDVYGLQGISGDLLGKTFTLANNIDASAATNWNGGAGFSPIGGDNAPFAGRFDGIGRTIANLTIISQATSAGLFGSIGPGGSVQNLSLTGAGLTGGGQGGFYGLLAGSNFGIINNVSTAGSVSTAHVSSGLFAIAGGVVGLNAGTINNSSSTASVSIGGGAAGGFVGFNLGAITLSYAKGNVTGGDTAFLGGFAGINAGTINQGYATGAVTGGDGSFAGGFAGINLAFNLGANAAPSELTFANSGASGSITQSYALGPVTVGNAAFAGSFAAFNFGGFDQVYGVGRVQGGAGSTLGGLVAADNTSTIVPDIGLGDVGTNVPAGTASNSYWDVQTTGLTGSAGGTGKNTAGLANGLPPGFDPAIWSHGSYPQLANLGTQNTTPGDPVIPPVVTPDDTLPLLPPPNQQVDVKPIQGAAALVANSTVNAQKMAQQFLSQQQSQPKSPPGNPGGKGPAGGGGGPTQTIQGPNGPVTIPGPAPIRLDVGENRYFYLPPPGETRLVSNEVVLQLPCDTPQAELDAILKQQNLTVLDQQCLRPGGNAVYRMRYASNRGLEPVIRALAAHRVIAAAQANYTYALAETSVQSVTSEQGDPGQYVPEKLHLAEVHRLVRGEGVAVAVIDSEIDVTHPDLSGAIKERYDATGTEDAPHPHGTGMAGAIVARQKLLGVAPAARVVAVRAFSSRASSESTTINILKGLEWAIDHNVRIVNMSFAGPRDPSLERALKAAYDKGIILIAAAGNAGPRSAPLFPAADPHVLAVTATDIDDQLFVGANRGTYLAVAAPGVDILVPAPAGEYQVTTGTSVATAHISGVVALLLQRNPKLTPADVRQILRGSAKRLGPTNQFGAGLVDPVRALQMATPRSAAVPTR